VFDSFGAFVQAVWVHAITLAAGCVVTVMLGLFERHILKRPVSARTEIAILLAFVFFACFQAWRDEHREAIKKQIEDLKARPPQVQVNMPPPFINFPAQQAFMTFVARELLPLQIGSHVRVQGPILEFHPLASEHHPDTEVDCASAHAAAPKPRPIAQR
jgi:hypothetical protein